MDYTSRLSKRFTGEFERDVTFLMEIHDTQEAAAKWLYADGKLKEGISIYRERVLPTRQMIFGSLYLQALKNGDGAECESLKKMYEAIERVLQQMDSTPA